MSTSQQELESIEEYNKLVEKLSTVTFDDLANGDVSHRRKIHYYVINLPRCSDRKERILHRLHHHKIADLTSFIDAVDRDSPLLDWFEDGLLFPYRSTRAEHACFLSHIKALRAFVADPHAEEAIILEDDAMLHNDFNERLEYVLTRKGDAEMLMLCFLAASWEGVKKIQEEELLPASPIPNPPDFFSIAPKIFGAVGYWISKDYAHLCLARLDRSLRQISETFVTSELITRLSNGYFISPPLIIEEAIYSTLRQGNDLDVHRKFFSHFGLENYSSAEREDIKNLWKPIGYNPLDTPQT